MRKWVFAIVLLIGSFFYCLPKSQAQETAQFVPIFVNNLKIDVVIKNDATYQVTQKFNLFGLYESGDFSWIISGDKISNLKILSNDKKLRRTQYGLRSSNGETTISRLKTVDYSSYFEISYVASRSIVENKDSAEWRMEVIPSNSFIGSVDMTVSLPQALAVDQTKPKIYAIHGVTDANYDVIDGQTIHFSGNSLGPYSSFTTVLQLPKNILHFSISQRFWDKMFSLSKIFWLSLSLILPLITFTILLIVYLRQRKTERIGPVAYQVKTPPVNISAATLGVLYREKITEREIVAMILNLAQRGYIYLVDKGNYFHFGRRREPVGLKDYEKVLYNELLGGGLSASESKIAESGVKELFSQTINQIYLSCYREVAGLGYFLENPRKIHLHYKYIGIILFFLGLILFVLSAYLLADLPVLLFGFLGITLASFVVIRMAGHLSLRTSKGSQILSQWMSFRTYLFDYRVNTAYKDIMENLFQQYLPYSVVLGVEQEWAGHFVNMPFVAPDWFVTNRDNLTLIDFANSLYPMLNYISGIMASLKEPSID